jgi:hypothetical protein
MGDQAGGAVGRLSLAGAPQLDDLPVDPLQLLAALGVTEMPSDLSTIPTVALSFSDDPSAYVVTYIDRQPITGKILFRREVYLHWHADKPRRPFLVKVFDHRGRRVMTARLDDWQRIDTTTMFDPPDRTPMMPTDIRIDLHPPRRTDQPDRTRIGSIRLRLADMQAEMNDDEESRWDRAAALLWQRLPADLPPESLQPIDAHLSVPAGETP